MKQSRIVWLMLLVLLVASACTLTASNDNNDDSEDDSVIDIPQNNDDDDIIVIGDGDNQTVPTNTPRPTNTPQPTNTPIANNNSGNGSGSGSGSNGGNTVVCTPRTDWQLYYVVSGDTMSSIARRVNSTVNILASANCISDPSVITVGQALRVPQQPTSPSTNEQIGYVTPSVFENFTSGIYVLGTGTTTTLGWQAANYSGMSSVQFLYYPYGSTNGTLIGTDSYLVDGATTNWTIPDNLNGRVVARGTKADGGIRYSADMLVSSTNPVQATGYVRVTPSTSLGNYQVQVNENTTAVLTWPELNPADVLRVEFYMLIASAATQSPNVIAVDDDMSDGINPSVTFLSRMAGETWAIAYMRNRSTVVTANSIVIFNQPSDTFQGNVSVSPYVRTEGNTYIIQQGQTVTLRWENMPTGITWVEFYYQLPGSLSPVSIGIDSNVNDGVSVTWQVLPLTTGEIYAAGRRPGQTHSGATSNPLSVSVQDVPAPPPISTTNAAYQDFQNGMMLWRSDTDAIYVLRDDNTYTTYASAEYRAYPENPILEPAPPNLFKPVQGFGRVWGNVESERTALGYGLAAEQSYTMEVQNFTSPDAFTLLSLPGGTQRVALNTDGTWVLQQ